MRPKLPKPYPAAMIYDDPFLHVCLASHPIARGHTVIVWKKDVPDLHSLDRYEYDYLMSAVNAVRNAMLKALKIRKVYLIYMDEARHVRWHLIPRHNIKGYNVFLHRPAKIKDFSLAPKIKRFLTFNYKGVYTKK